ncbi:ABC transporter substrate-binding protein [Patulibacter minatonensis]|uniref:ABC transporter substrate-binding protein n=1 Tax=Patulibacter minatonensis TaxID=298163 RepID=UPI0006857668|nr:ABC transporter substrate-binding protein [Patulibacter minatonensis]
MTPRTVVPASTRVDRRSPLRRASALAVAATSALVLAACGSSDDDATTASTGTSAASGPRTTYPLTVVNCGRKETFDAAPKRAVAVAQPAIETLLSLGVQGSMAGTASWSDPVLPSLAKANARVPRLADDFPSFERVLKTEPDLVYSTFDYTFSAEGIASRDRFEKLGVPTYQSVAECKGQESTQSRPQTMEDTYAEIRDMARIFDVQSRGTTLIDTLKARMAKATGGVSAKDVSLGWWYANTKTPYFAGCCGAAGIVTRELGAKNAFGDSKQLFPTVGWETILERDPTVLVLADLTRGDDGDSAKAKIAFLEKNPVARRLTAVRKKRYVIVTGSEMDQSIRNVDATEKIAAGLRKLGLAG